MESVKQRIAGIKAIINNLKLSQEGTVITYEFLFENTNGKVKISDGNVLKEVAADIAYTDVFQIQIENTLYTISSLIHGGKVKISLNNGQIILSSVNS